MQLGNENQIPQGGDASHPASEDVITRKVREGASRLHSAIRDVVDQIPVSAEGPQAFARKLGLHKSLANKVLNAVRLADPIAVVKQLPRSEGLGIFLRAAGTSVSKERVKAAESAVGEFQAMVKRDIGGWDELDVAICSWLPEARAEAELASGRQVYSGLRSVLGVTADILFGTMILYRSADGEHCDTAVIAGPLGLRRLRPGKEIRVESIGPRPDEPDPSTGVSSLSDSHDPDGLPLLKQFCSPELPPFRIIQVGQIRHFVMGGNAFGVRAGVDILFGLMFRGARPLYQPESGPKIHVAASTTISIPSKKLVFNTLLADDVYPDCEPELVLHEIHERGPASPNDRTRDIDRMDTTATLQYLGRGANSFHVTEFARHAELVQYVCDRLGWNINRLRGYRYRVQYPLSIGQYSVVFEPPGRPTKP